MKNLRWDDESWIKMYTRDPAEFLALSFDASGLLMHLWRKVDKSGVFAVGDVDRAEVSELLALTFRIDASRMDAALAELLRRKFVVVAERDGQQVVVVPDFEPAQSARATDRVRQQEKRKRDRDAAISSAKPTSSSRAVTPCHAPSRIEEKRREEKREEETRPEGVQGEQAPYAPKTQPNPSLRSKDLEEAIGKGSESWVFEGQDVANQSERRKDLEANTPPQERPVPSPQLARQGPLVTVVEPKPVQGQNPPSKGTTKPKAKGRRADDEGDPLPVDWSVKDNHYDYARAKLGAQKKHVDYWADDMRDTAKSRGWRSKDWDAKFRTFMRKAMEFSRGMLPNVPDPVAVEPKRPMPPCPPPEPHIVEAAKRWGERMANGEKIDFKAMMKNVGMRLPELPPDPPELAQWRKEDGLDSP